MPTRSNLTAQETDSLLARFSRFTVPHAKKSFEVYATKTGTKPLLLLHEITGLAPDTFDLALRLEDAGFSVYMPVLFGEPGHRLNIFGMIAAGLHPASNPFALHEVSPRVEVARATLGEIEKHSGSRPIGIIGMCLTANFGIELLPDPRVGAAVLSQPAIPFALTRWHKRSLGVSDAAIDAARDSRKPMFALRFATDTKCPDERWARLESEFTDANRIVLHPIPTGEPPWNIPKNAHAVLTSSYEPDRPDGYPTHDAFRKVACFLDRSL